MKLTKQAPKNKDFGPRQYPEEGVWGATLFKIAIIGKHAPRGKDTFNKGVQRLIRFTFEMPEQLMKDENGVEDVTMPFIASIDVPLYTFLADRAGITKIVKAIVGRDVEEVDLKDLLGKPADIHIAVNEGKDGKKYTNIKAVTQMKERDKKDWPDPINPTCFFNFYEPDIDEWNKLYDWEKERITQAADFPSSKLQMMLENISEKQTKNDLEPSMVANEYFDDDTPF